MRDSGGVSEEDLTRLQLDVYETRHGPWNPQHGPLRIPDGWAFLPSGDAFVMRTVKASGFYWLAWQPRGRDHPHRRKLGLWAPTEVIAQAQNTAEQTASRRARGREQGARQRARVEDRYRVELAQVIVEYLAFSPAHQALATEIAEEAATRAATVGSGRVGRARSLPVEERAVLAARAWIRHRHTDYEDQLDASYGDEFLADELNYRAVKTAAQAAVNDFISTHRGAG
jgi:hypothetical protein